MFWVTANIPFKRIGDGSVDSFMRRANLVKALERSANLIDSSRFKEVAEYYNISPDPKDYGFLSALAVRADVPNDNGDAASTEELHRYRPHRRALSYQTFILSPLHINHFSSDPTRARGFIVDAVFNTWDEDFNFVETLVAVDKKKDPVLANALLSGEIKTFSMGSIVDALKCNACGKVAYSEPELCECLRHHRMQEKDGKLVFAWNIGIDYEELSVVDVPAEKKATTRRIFAEEIENKIWRALVSRLPPSERVKLGGFEKVASLDVDSRKAIVRALLDLSDEDVKWIKKFAEYNKEALPDYILKVLRRI